MKKLLVVIAIAAMMVVVNNSAVADVTINGGIHMTVVKNPPVITVDPVDTSAYETDTWSLTIQYIGLGVSCQWYDDAGALVDGPTADGSIISGAQTPTLTFTGTMIPDSGNYYCVATNAKGSVQSATATVTVRAMPTVTFVTLPAFMAPVPPDPLGTLNVEELTAVTYTLTVTPSGSDPQPSAVTITWTKNGGPLGNDPGHIALMKNTWDNDLVMFTPVEGGPAPVADDTGDYLYSVRCAAPLP